MAYISPSSLCAFLGNCGPLLSRFISVCVSLLRSGGLKVRLVQDNCIGKFKGKERAESLVLTKDDLGI